jgi:hypothetical protein
MQRTQNLSAVQRRAVERLARSQGCKCHECGSPGYLESGEKAVLFVSSIGVELFCANPLHSAKVLALSQSFPLTFGQAARIGLTVPPSDPPTRRRPGETFLR